MCESISLYAHENPYLRKCKCHVSTHLECPNVQVVWESESINAIMVLFVCVTYHACLRCFYSHLQVLSLFLTSCSLRFVVSLCSYWRQRWASTPVREESCAGGRSAPYLKVKYKYLSGFKVKLRLKKHSNTMARCSVVSRDGIRRPNDCFLWMHQLCCDLGLGLFLPVLFVFW